MSDYKQAKAQIELANEIANGKLSSSQVKKRLNAMKKAYDAPFSQYIPTRKEKPWNLAYLKSLRETIAFGSGSEAQFLYMQEVADVVYKRRRLIRSALWAVVTIAAVIAVFATIISLLGRGK